MILDGINPSNILLFTFTNKAAKEIKERIASAVGSATANKITMGTYHSFCCRLLRKYASKIGYENRFTIFDAEDSKKLLTKIAGKDIDERMLGSYISKQKHNMISPAMAMNKSTNNKDPYAMYYDLYQKELKSQNAMDFDDLIYNAIRLLQTNPDVLEKVNKKYLYISSDESQDSSNYDIKLMKLLAGDNNNICFMLDEDQSIYGFRGADIDAVMNIRNMFPNFKTYVLSKNYRSSQNIVDGSRSLISHNPRLIDKKVESTNALGNKIMYVSEKSADYEAVRVAKLIQKLNLKYKVPLKEMAVLYRTSAQSRAVEDMLLKYKIPYEVLSGTNFYARKEIKDLTSFIYFLVNPYNVEKFTRIVNIPKHGIGEKTIEKIVDEARKDPENIIDLVTACNNLLEADSIKGKGKAGLEQFLDIFNYLREEMDNCSVTELLGKLIDKLNYYDYLKNEDEDSYEDRCANVIELIEVTREFDTLQEFLDQTCLERKDDEDGDNKVNLLTMHMSKGLEWRVVFMIGLNDGTCPHYKSLSSPSAIEEERRLFYVAMTRAKEYLFLLRPEMVKINGYFQETRCSRFVNEIDDKYIYKS